MAVRVLLIVLLAATVSAAQNAGSPAKSPEAAFEAARTAASKSDLKALFAAVDPATLDELAADCGVAGAALRGLAPSAGADLKARIDGVSAVLDRHGLTATAVKKVAPEDEKKRKEAYLALVKDKVGFLAEVLPAMAKGGKAEAPSWAAGAKLENLKVDGSTATAVVVGKAGKEPIAFVKVGEAWFVKPTFRKAIERP
jgi:hypothetical protein